jgi:hypothetical protein
MGLGGETEGRRTLAEGRRQSPFTARDDACFLFGKRKKDGCALACALSRRLLSSHSRAPPVAVTRPLRGRRPHLRPLRPDRRWRSSARRSWRGIKALTQLDIEKALHADDFRLKAPERRDVHERRVPRSRQIGSARLRSLGADLPHRGNGSGETKPASSIGLESGSLGPVAEPRSRRTTTRTNYLTGSG